MFPLWLVSYPLGALRPRKRARDEGDGGFAPRLQLPRPPWFVDVLRAEGLSLEPPSSSMSRRSLFGLALVTRGTMDNGLITSWHREAELQRIYYRWPSDAFSLRLARFVALGGSHVDVYRRSGNAVAAFADKLLDHRRLLFAPHFVEDAGTFVTTDSRSITDVLHSWGGGHARSARFLH